MPTQISNFLSSDNIVLDLRASDKATLLRDLSRRAAAIVHIPAETLYLELAKREQLGSTGIGEGIAIPHAQFAGLRAPFGIVARLKPPIDYEAVDEQQVDLVFVILVPASSEKEHLNALAAAARRLREREVVRKLRAAPDKKAFYLSLIGDAGQPL
jgi:PTS system nitrogen regulatory IIA component